MPDRATMEAATPKCPVSGCALMLSWVNDRGVWACGIHGRVLTGFQAGTPDKAAA